MIRLLLRFIIKNLPWLLLITVGLWLYFSGKWPFYTHSDPENIQVDQEILLAKLELMGKLELVKYNFKEITQVEQTSKWKMFFQSYSPDMRAALITSGEAVCCIDLSKLTSQDLNLVNDTLYVILPPPEICYYKIDLENSRIYDLETGFLATNEEERKFVEGVYKSAENKIKKSAMENGILEMTKANADKFLIPFLQEFYAKPIKLNYKIKEVQVNPNF